MAVIPGSCTGVDVAETICILKKTADADDCQLNISKRNPTQPGQSPNIPGFHNNTLPSVPPLFVDVRLHSRFAGNHDHDMRRGCYSPLTSPYRGVFTLHRIVAGRVGQHQGSSQPAACVKWLLNSSKIATLSCNHTRLREV